MANGNQDGLTGWSKIQGNWVVEIGGRMARGEDAGDMYLRRPRPTQRCTADDEDDDYDDDDEDDDDDDDSA